MAVPHLSYLDLFPALRIVRKPPCSHRIGGEPACEYKGWHITCGHDHNEGGGTCFFLDHKDRTRDTACMWGFDCPAVTRYGAAVALYLKHGHSRESVRFCSSFAPVRDTERLIVKTKFALLTSPQPKAGRWAG